MFEHALYESSFNIRLTSTNGATDFPLPTQKCKMADAESGEYLTTTWSWSFVNRGDEDSVVKHEIYSFNPEWDFASTNARIIIGGKGMTCHALLPPATSRLLVAVNLLVVCLSQHVRVILSVGEAPHQSRLALPSLPLMTIHYFVNFAAPLRLR